MSILSRKIYAACSSEIFLSEILVENQNCTISVGIFSVYISKGFIPFRNRVIPNADHWQLSCDPRSSFYDPHNEIFDTGDLSFLGLNLLPTCSQ